MESLVGHHIGRYKIVKYLDSGGMGVVYEAYDPYFERQVALKALPVLASADKKARIRFNREAKTIASLEHAAIVPVYDSGEHENQLYFVMRLMKGGALSNRLKENPPSLAETTGIIKRLAPALDMAHSRGVIHRDLKPSNILFDEEGKAYLSDFGIAKIIGDTASLTGSHVVGTWPYMCPEQFQGGKVDWRADIYACGIILFEMLTGQRPFEADTPMEWIGVHLNNPVPFIHEIRHGLPLGYEAIVEKAMAKKPEDRFESAGQMAEALESLARPDIDEQERESLVAAIKLSDTVDTVTGSGVEKRSLLSHTVHKWLPWTIVTVLVLVGMLVILLPNITGILNSPTVIPNSPDKELTSPAMTPLAITPNTPLPVIEGIIVFVLYDPVSAIYQKGDGGIARIPENGQLSLPTAGESVLLQSNAGLMEVLLPDKTRLFIDQNSSLLIEQVRDFNKSERTIVTLDQGLVVVSNEANSVTIKGPLDTQTEMNTGMMEVKQSGLQVRVDIDCINGICPISVGGDSDLTLQAGESTFVTDSDEVASIGGARYNLYNNIITGLFITPTPTIVPSPSPTASNTPEPTRPGPETIEIGRSVNNRPIEAVQFGNGPDVIIFVGGLHAGLAPSTVTLAEESIDYFREYPEEIPENVTLFIIPSANPDSPISIGEKEGRYNANGVDLNRNWDCGHVEDPFINGTIEPGRGGAEPFSEPEVVTLRDFILNNDPKAVVFWMARASEGLSSPGACSERSLVSNELAEIYGSAANYPFIADIENVLGFELNGDAMNWLDKMGVPTIAVLLRDYVETDFQRNLAGMRAVMNQSRSEIPALPIPDLPPAPNEIVFQSNRDGDYEIFIMNIDGSNQRQLTFNNAADQFPRVSPNGRQIVFESDRDGNPEIYIMNRDGSNQQRLTFDPANDRLPAWSPDGKQITFHSSRNEEESEIYIMNINGTGLQRITLTSAVEGHTSWSINHQLVFNAREPEQNYWQIYTSAADGSNLQRITHTEVDEWSPEWSPDGELILFLSERESRGNPGIFIMNPDGSETQLLYNGPLVEWGPIWSADGEQIVFAEDQLDNTADIFILNIDNPNEAYRLTERGGYPSWATAIEATDVSTLATTDPTSPCLSNALSRWRDNIYPEFADRLGCVTSSEMHFNAVYQLYPNGLMVWREDTNIIYVLYYAESYEIHPVTLPNDTEFYFNDRTKGAIGYLWLNNLSIQSQLGNPLEPEMGTSEFTLQAFANGIIFYFKENNANTYVLMADQNEVRMIQEK